MYGFLTARIYTIQSTWKEGRNSSSPHAEGILCKHIYRGSLSLTNERNSLLTYGRNTSDGKQSSIVSKDLHSIMVLIYSKDYLFKKVRDTEAYEK